MVIVWGTKIRREKAGYYASLCTCCQQVTVNQVTDLYSVSHLYYIPLGRGTHEASEVECKNCGNLLQLKPYHDLSIHPSSSLDVLLDEVPAETRSKWDRVVEQNEKIRQDPTILSADERQDRIVKAFASLESTVATKLQTGQQVDGAVVSGLVTWAAIWAIILGFGTTMAKWEWIRRLAGQLGTDPLGLGMLTILGSGVIILVWLVATHKFRVFKKQVYPRIAASLAFLEPTRAELEHCKQTLKYSGMKVGGFSVSAAEKALARMLDKRRAQ